MVQMWQTVLHLLIVSCSCMADPLQSSASTNMYNEVPNALLCIRSSFTEIRSEAINKILCAVARTKNPRCQAFSTADGPCQLFVFDKCSKSVKDCSCSRRGQVFVKQQPGLEPGALCPSGYGDDLCGVKYRVHVGSMNWLQGREICESENGLVIMADVMDMAEMGHVEMLRSTYLGPSHTFFLGGIQAPPGSPEQAGVWYWIGCNITIDSSLWNAVEPNDAGLENVVGRYYSRTHLADFKNHEVYHGAVCECVSPLD